MKNTLLALLLMSFIAAPLSAQSVDCGCEDKPLPEVLGTVNGVKITKQDLSPETQARVKELQQQVVDARARELDLQIESILLEAEAKKRGVTPSQVIKDEVIAKAQQPTEAEAQAFYDQNKARIKAEFKDEKSNIVQYLSYQRQQEQAGKFAERLRAAAQLKLVAKLSAPAVTDADRAKVLAIVNEKQITAGDIETSLRPVIAKVQEEVYALRKEDLELKINDTLLAHEAQKKGVTTRALLEAEVTAKVARVTDADAQAFYDQNKDRISGDFAQTKPQIMQYLQERKEREATIAFADQLRRASTIQINLTGPEARARNSSENEGSPKGK